MFVFVFGLREGSVSSCDIIGLLTALRVELVRHTGISEPLPPTQPGRRHSSHVASLRNCNGDVLLFCIESCPCDILCIFGSPCTAECNVGCVGLECSALCALC